MSSGADRRDEQFARAIVGKVTGATVTRTDHKDAPAGTVDARIDYPDGTTGALEISTLGLPSEFDLEARIKKLDGKLPMPGRWKWVIKVANPRELRRILRVYANAIVTCEAHEVSSIDELPSSVVEADPDLEWLWTESTSSLFGIKLPEGAQDVSGYVDLSYHPVIAGWHTGPDPVVAGVNAALVSEPLSRRVAKLERADGDERHLFLRVTFSGLEESALARLILQSISSEHTEPLTGDPDLPETVDHLWLLTGWGQRVTRWTRGIGWDHPTFK